MALKPVFASHDLEELSTTFDFEYDSPEWVSIIIDEECVHQGVELDANRYDLTKNLSDGSEIHLYLYADDEQILAIDNVVADIFGGDADIVDTDISPFKGLYKYLTKEDQS